MIQYLRDYKKLKKTNQNNGPGKLRRKLFLLQQTHCDCCGSTKNLTCDHIVPLCLGGRDYKDNYQCLCFECNRIKGVLIIDFKKKLFVFDPVLISVNVPLHRVAKSNLKMFSEL